MSDSDKTIYYFVYFIVGAMSLLLYVMFFYWMFRIVRATELTAQRLESLSQIQASVDNLRRHLVDDHKASVARSAEGYDESLIPETRFYAHVGNISTRLVKQKLVTAQQIDWARAEFARRGGHLCDHLLAMGALTEDQLREAIES